MVEKKLELNSTEEKMAKEYIKKNHGPVYDKLGYTEWQNGVMAGFIAGYNANNIQTEVKKKTCECNKYHGLYTKANTFCIKCDQKVTVINNLE